MIYNLITTGSSDTKNKKSLFYLGNWCHNFKEKKFDEIKNFQTHKYHWSNKKKFSKDCKKIAKLTEAIFLDLYKTLNKIHKINEPDEYWRVVIYQWLTNYITIFFDRWETSKSFLKKNNKDKFILNYFNYNKKIFYNNNHIIFFEKANSDEWNNYLYKIIFTYLDSSVIFKYIKTNKKKNPYTNFKKKNNYFSTFKKNFDKYLSKVAFSFNPIIFESFYFPLKFYLPLCVRNYLIPARYQQFFSIEVKNLYNNQLRLEAKKYLSQKIKFHDKSFKKFIYINIFQDIPLSYLENFLIYKFNSEKLAKDKKCIISMFSIVWNDYFKIYLAEAKKKGSKIIISDHGGGLYPKYNSNYKFYEKVYHKKISYRKKYKNDFYLSLNPTLPYLSKDKITGKKKNLLFCLTDISKYQNKIVSIPFFDDWIVQLEKLIKNIRFIKKEIKPFLKFRIKNIREDQNICESIIKNNFKFSKIENESTRPFFETISDSKIIVHNFAQTAFTESMHFNIPSILICNSSTMIFDKDSLKIFKLLKKNDIAFENIRDCIDFLNKNWNNIESWWNSKQIQKARKAYLDSHFTSYEKPLKKWDIFLKKIKKDLNKPLLFNE